VGDAHREPLDADVDADDPADERADEADAAEVEDGVVHSREAIQRDDDPSPVTERPEVRLRVVRARAVRDRDDLDGLSVFHTLDRQLRLDREPVGGQREPLERRSPERPVAAEDVPEVPSVDVPEGTVDDPVPELVETGHRSRLHVGEPVPDDVVRPSLEQRFEHPIGVGGIVSPVAVDHQHELRVDQAHALSNGLSLSRSRLLDDARALAAGDIGGAVGRAAVDDENVVVAALDEARDHVTDGCRLVERRDEHADVVGHHPPCAARMQKGLGPRSRDSGPRRFSRRFERPSLLPAFGEVFPDLGTATAVGRVLEVVGLGITHCVPSNC